MPPAMENRQKIPVPRRSFLWSLNETSGEILTHIGPTEFTPSANDRIVRANGRGGFEPAPMEARPSSSPATASTSCSRTRSRSSRSTAASNGGFVPGGNKEKELKLGTKKIIPGPCAFPLWPGQSAEVRPAHKLGANQYLLSRSSAPIDESAPYFKLVIDSAKLSSVVIDADDGARTAAAPPASPSRRQGRAAARRPAHRHPGPPHPVLHPAVRHRGRARARGRRPRPGEDDGVASLPPAAVEELARLSPRSARA
jgi:major vault protein